jgi:hypothetical protein
LEPLLFEFTPDEVVPSSLFFNIQKWLRFRPGLWFHSLQDSYPPSNRRILLKTRIPLTVMYNNLPPGYIFRSTFKITVSGGLLFVAYEMFSGNELFYKNYVCIF